jgi:hypothetical protein
VCAGPVRPGYLIAISRESQESTLTREEASLANFAGQVEAVAKALEGPKGEGRLL